MSWSYQPEDDGSTFMDKPALSQWIFAFYWSFVCITTVGYGDYTGNTTEEYLFSIFLEFVGLIFFSFLMGSIRSIFN
jgi:hypothetical protein